MNLIQSKGKIWRAVLTLSLLSGVGLATASTAQAQYGSGQVYQYQRDRDQRDHDRDRGEHRGRNWDRYGNYGGSFQLRQTALNAGYNEGIKQGRKDRGHRGRDFRGNSAYRNADHDYNSRLGDKELYRRYYREGYENGYNDGYNGY